jgi:SnoaL-like domain
MDAQTVVQAFYNAIDSGDLARAESYMTDDFTFSGAVPRPIGKPEFRAFMDALLAAMPDVKLNAKNITVQGSNVSLTVQLTATHTATLPPIKPGMLSISATGKKITLPRERVNIALRDDKLASLEVAQVPGGGVPGLLAQIGA